MESVQAKTVLSNLVIPGATVRYRFIPVGGTTITFDDLCAKVATASGLAVSTVKYALETCNQKMIDLLIKNYRVHTGLYVASLGISGSVGSMGEQPTKVNNPVHAVLTPEGSIVDTLKTIEVQNITAVVDAIINEVQQVDCEELNKIVSPYKNVIVNGRNIKLDSTKSDEGVWLANRTTGAVVKTGAIISTDSSRLTALFDDLPEDGQYDLVIATRNCETDKDVVTVKRMVTVEAVL